MKINLLKVFIFLLVVSGLHAQPRIWNMKSLEHAKDLTSEASKYLIRSADKELNKTIAAVVDKKTTPPSGDKHDYLSQGRYWWPNPKTADGLPFIRKDGVVNPEIEDFDRGALGWMARSIKNLSLAYYFTSDEKYASKAVENLRIWFINKETKMNPNMNFGQTIPGKLDGKGRGEGVLDTYSFVEMLDGIELLKNSRKFTTDDNKAIMEWFTTYLDWMLTSNIGNEENAAKNNHGTAFDIQATRYALFVGKEDIATKIITEFPARRLFTQIQPDGSQPFELARTTALGYSVYNLTHFLDMSCMAKSLDFDLFNAKSPDGRSITQAIDFLVQYIGKPQSEFPYKQIKDWDAVQTKLRWELYRADKFISKPVYSKYYLNELNLNGKEYNLIIY